MRDDVPMSTTADPDPWDEHAGGWDTDPATRAYAAAAFDSLVSTLDRFGRRLDGLDVCDFGCGTGLLTERMAAAVASIDAVDTSSGMLARLSTKVDAHGWTNVRTSTAIPTTSAGHDLVVCSSVLAFVDDVAATTKRLVGLLRPGGVFVQWDWEFDPDDAEPFGLTRDGIRATLEAAGLVDVAVDVAFELPYQGETMRPLIGVGRTAVSDDTLPDRDVAGGVAGER